MTDNDIIKAMGWTAKDGQHDAMLLRRARDLVDAARRERENEIREAAQPDAHEAFEREMRGLGYDVKKNEEGIYFWLSVRDMWRGWELMRTRAAAQRLFGGGWAA